MLNDIRLTPYQLESLTRAAEDAGGNLVLDYRGPFRPADQPVSVALLCAGPASLVRFAIRVAMVSMPLAGQLAARIAEAPCGERRAYYWPGILAEAGAEPEAVPAMLKVAGKRFACTCGANVFTRTGEVFTCNGCGTQYAEPAA